LDRPRDDEAPVFVMSHCPEYLEQRR
jgi:hypothetical protein